MSVELHDECMYWGDRDAWDPSLEGTAPDVDVLADVQLGRKPASALEATGWRISTDGSISLDLSRYVDETTVASIAKTLGR
jgi:hypothetical protein